jgi:hypothetical protein
MNAIMNLNIYANHNVYKGKGFMPTLPLFISERDLVLTIYKSGKDHMLEQV